MSKRRKIFLGFIVMFALIAAVVALAAPPFANALLTFKGIDLVKNGDTTQAFIDVILSDIDTPGISFCLQYDTKYMQLSDADTNVPIENKTTVGAQKFNLEHKYFNQNTEAFPTTAVSGENVFNDSNKASPLYYPIVGNIPIIGIASQDKNQDTGNLIMNFLPKDEAVGKSEYIKSAEIDDGDGKEITRAIIATDGIEGGVKLGTLSFYIKDPAKFAKLSSTDLDSIIKIIPFNQMLNFQDPEKGEDGVYLSYIDSDGDVQWYYREDKNIKYSFDLDVNLESVKLDKDSFTVTAYDIYKDGTKQDLIDYLNENASKLILTYADNSEVLATMDWDIDKATVNTMWNPKGGSYTVTQKYKDDKDNDFEIKATVTVTSVNIVGFDVDNKNITYLYGSESFPTMFEQLNLAKKARPILNTYIPDGGLAAIDIRSYMLKDGYSEISELPSDFGDGTKHSYTFLGNLNLDIETGDEDNPTVNYFAYYPWLTNTSLPLVEMVRNVVTDPDDMPNTLEVVSAVTNNDGVLTINVRNAKKNADDADYPAIPDGTTFSVFLPDGSVIEGSACSVTINGDGTATIEVSPDITQDTQKKAAQIINMGERAGAFKISSKEPDKYEGSATSFYPNSRRNIYSPDIPEYEYDFSGSLSSLFPVKASSTAGVVPLSKTITLPTSEKLIQTTYSGYDGTIPGELQTFTVNSWTIFSGDVTKPGSIIEVRGELASTEYASYGKVYNDNSVSVTLKYLVSSKTGEDSIEPISDFIYNKQMIGYDYDKLETHSFTIKNNGTTTIAGLTAVISLAADNGKEAFLQTNNLPYTLAKDESTNLDISTKHGLPAGKYISTVTLYSIDKELGSFKITFEVTDKEVHKVTVKVKDGQKDFGKVKTEGAYSKDADEKVEVTASADEIITITAEPDEYCTFVGWTVTPSGVTLGSSTNTTTTFTMPNEDVEIVAEFKEKTVALLRATDLYIQPEGSESHADLNDKDWKKVEFDPKTKEYYVVVSNDTEKVVLGFKPRDEIDSADKKVTLEQQKDTTPTSITVNINDPAAEGDYYITDDMTLEASPVDNKIILEFEMEDEDSVKQNGTYTIHVYQKLKASDLVTFNYGNSPYGMIERASNITEKDTSKKSFLDNGYKFILGNVPTGLLENSTYTPKAWGTDKTNYDLDETALFINNSQSFKDPGYKKLTNSIGQNIDKKDVSRSIKVKILGETIDANKNGSSEDFSFIKDHEEKTITLSDSETTTELAAERIRPDVYELVYTFKDYDGTEITVSRPLIIVYSLGDVNVDGTVSSTDGKDEKSIRDRYTIELADQFTVKDYDVGGKLFEYRICDVNKDNVVNAIDANAIRSDTISSPFYSNSHLEGGGG